MDFYKTLLIGGSGSGKTFASKELAQEGNKTCFLNLENKPLPFKGKFLISKVPTTTKEVLDLMQQASLGSNVDCLFIDSLSKYFDFAMAEAKTGFKGWDVMNYFNGKVAEFHETLQKVQKETFVTAHYEVIGDEMSGMRERRAKIKGKEWEGMIEKEYTIVFFVRAVPRAGLTPERFFEIVTDGTHTAKCPPEIFGADVLRIPNDAKFVFDKIQAFKS